jgi:hypothetical protein
MSGDKASSEAKVDQQIFGVGGEGNAFRSINFTLGSGQKVEIEGDAAGFQCSTNRGVGAVNGQIET